jgi:hypothetical protein
MSGSDDGDLLDSLDPQSFKGSGNFFENLFSDVVNYGAQAGTFGMVGFKDGQVRTGVTSTALIQGTKEITGAKAAEDANKLAKEQFEKQKADAEQARAEAINQNARDQVQQSRMAGAARASSVKKLSDHTHWVTMRRTY